MDRDLDAKLNIFALANGMDLKRTESRRRLEWHRDGLERGILFEEGPGGTLDVSALAWNHGDASSLRKTTVRAGLDAATAAHSLTALLAETLDAANAL